MARNYNLLDDLNTVLAECDQKPEYASVAERMRKSHDELMAQGVESYDALFSFIKNEAVDPLVRRTGVYAIAQLEKHIDRRKAIPRLKTALNTSTDHFFRSFVVRIICMLSQTAGLKLLPLAYSKTEDEGVRIGIIDSLHSIKDELVLQKMRAIVFDESDSIQVRGTIIEFIFSRPNYLPETDYIALLAHPSADLRFWAAYSLVSYARLAETVHPELLAALDQVAAYDHRLPVYWGWHVDREVLEPLTELQYMPYRKYLLDEENQRYSDGGNFLLISPAAEYDRFIAMSRQWDPSWQYTTLLTPTIETHIKVEWLRSMIEAQWPDARFDVIPSPREVYLLDWLIERDGYRLLGGLHRDQYAVVLKGPAEIAHPFIDWYRSIRTEESLYVYDWAFDDVELKPGRGCRSLNRRNQASGLVGATRWVADRHQDQRICRSAVTPG